MNISTYLIEISRLFTCFVLLIAAYGKLNTFTQFKDSLTASFGINYQWNATLALLIIIIETVLGLLILTNSVFTYLAMLGAFSVFIIFTSVIFVTLLKGQAVHCHCFGQANEKITYWDVTRNLLLILVCSYYLLNVDEQEIDLQSQLLLSGIAFSIFLIVTHLKEVVLISRNPKID